MKEVFTLTQNHKGQWAVEIGPEQPMRIHRRFSKAARASKENNRFQVIATVRPVRVLRFREPEGNPKPRPASNPFGVNPPKTEKPQVDAKKQSVLDRMKKAREARAAKAKEAAEQK